MTQNEIDLLSALRDAYIEIQTLVMRDVHNGSIGLAVKTDSLRARLRNIISKMTGADCKDVQESIESEANGRIQQ